MWKIAVSVINWAMWAQHSPRVPFGIKLDLDSKQVNWLKKVFWTSRINKKGIRSFYILHFTHFIYGWRKQIPGWKSGAGQDNHPSMRVDGPLCAKQGNPSSDTVIIKTADGVDT